MHIGVFEAKSRLSELLDRAARGEEVVITRRGQGVARLEPLTRGLAAADAEALLDRVRERRLRMRHVTGWRELRAGVEEGRP